MSQNAGLKQETEISAVPSYKDKSNTFPVPLPFLQVGRADLNVTLPRIFIFLVIKKESLRKDITTQRV